MKNEVVTPEIALSLKEVGFNEPCIFGYNDYNALKANIAITNADTDDKIPNNRFYSDLKAPLWQQVTAWFRNKYKLSIEINLIDNSIEFYYEYSIVCSNNRQHNDGEMLDQAEILYNDLKFKSYEEAREAGVLEAIELCKKTIHN